MQEKIEMINMPVHRQFIRIDLDREITYPSNYNCDAGVTNKIIVPMDGTDKSNRFYTALLTAFSLNKYVKIWTTGCTEGKYWGTTFPKGYDVYVFQKNIIKKFKEIIMKKWLVIYSLNRTKR